MKSKFDINLFKNIPGGVCVFRYDSEGYHTLFYSDEMFNMFGKSAKELEAELAKDFSDVVYPNDVKKMQALFYKVRVIGGNYSETIKILFKNNEYRWVNMRINSVAESDGSHIINIVSIDMHRQRENEAKLERTYEKLLGVMNNTPGGIIVFDINNSRDPYPSFISKGMYKLLNGDKSQLLAIYGNDVFNGIHPDDREKAIRVFEESLRNMSDFHLTIRIITAKNYYIWVELVGNIDTFGENRKVYLTISNVSKDVEKQRLLVQIIDTFAQHQFDSITVIDGNNGKYEVLSANQNFRKYIFKDLDDFSTLVKQVSEKYIVPEDRETTIKTLELNRLISLLKKNQDYKFYVSVILDGKRRYKLIWFCWIDEKNKKIAITISDDTDLHNKQVEHQEALASALKEAEQANIAKSVFLSRMSHDIRTPLNAIIGFTDISLADPTTEGNNKDRLEKIASASKFLLSLINDVLDMSRIESGKFIIKNGPIFTSNFIEGIKSIVFAQCELKNLTYCYHVDKNVRREYIGDKLKLQQVLVNILGNAVKFTPEGGTVSLNVEEIASYECYTVLRFTIKDTGIGISKEFLPHIFETFTQEDNINPNGQTGSGLGLAICKNIINLMNGTIRVESEKGVGSTFIVEVKLGIPEDKNVVSEANNEVNSLKKAPEEYDFHGKRILLAEDHPMNQEIARYLLEKVHFMVEIASNGKIACDMVSDKPQNYYSLIIMDIRMPIMDGIEATRTIRAMPREDTKKIPIIAMSADVFEEDISKSLANGINAHLIKPIDPSILYQTLSKYLK